MTCHRLTSERESYDWLPLFCLRLRYHDVYGRRKCSLLARDYPFVWQRHDNSYDFRFLPSPLYRRLFRALVWYLLVSLPPTFGCPPQGRTFLRSFSLDVGMLSRSFVSLSFSLTSFISFSFLLSRYLLFLFLLLPRPPPEIFPSLGCVLSDISHIHHVITVIFTLLCLFFFLILRRRGYLWEGDS